MSLSDEIRDKLKEETESVTWLGDLEGPVGILVNSFGINVINTMGTGLMNVVSTKTNWVGAFTFVGMKTKTGKEIQAGV